MTSCTKLTARRWRLASRHACRFWTTESRSLRGSCLLATRASTGSPNGRCARCLRGICRDLCSSGRSAGLQYPFRVGCVKTCVPGRKTYCSIPAPECIWILAWRENCGMNTCQGGSIAAPTCGIYSVSSAGNVNRLHRHRIRADVPRLPSNFTPVAVQRPDQSLRVRHVGDGYPDAVRDHPAAIAHVDTIALEARGNFLRSLELHQQEISGAGEHSGAARCQLGREVLARDHDLVDRFADVIVVLDHQSSQFLG